MKYPGSGTILVCYLLTWTDNHDSSLSLKSMILKKAFYDSNFVFDRVLICVSDEILFLIKLYCKELAAKLGRFKNLYISVNCYTVRIAIVNQWRLTLESTLSLSNIIFAFTLPLYTHT